MSNSSFRLYSFKNNMTLTKKTLLSVLISGALFIGFMAGLIYFKEAKPAIGNVLPGGELTATTTGLTSGFTGGVARIQSDLGNSNAKKSGMLGSIYFATVTQSQLCFYDATTTDINSRTGNISTTTLLLGCFPSGTGTSTVPLNVRYSNGLIGVWAGTVSSTTITSR